MATPHIQFHSLRNSDGSVTYTSPNKAHTIIAGVNYPVEVPYRSDEIPESTFIEVNLRPHNAVGMVKERHVESLVARTLETITRVEETPRSMLQVTLQVAHSEVDETLPGGFKDGGQGESYLPLLTSALNAAILACLDAAVQMRHIAGAALVGITRDGTILINPEIVERKKCLSLHVFCFTSTGDVILMESEGPLKFEDWERAQQRARSQVLDKGDTGLLMLMRRAVEAQATRNLRSQE
jgi:exosome complex component RRP46